MKNRTSFAIITIHFYIFFKVLNYSFNKQTKTTTTLLQLERKINERKRTYLL